MNSKNESSVADSDAHIAGVSLDRRTSIGATSGFGRRSFVKSLAAGSAALLLRSRSSADEDEGGHNPEVNISNGDADILRFLAAAETLETDLWQQYNEFALQAGPYMDALEVIDGDMPSYVTQNTSDEFSHQSFLNALLVKHNKTPVNLEPFRTLSSSPVAPVQRPRLTNLMHLNVDTSWYLRYRSSHNPDFGATFGQVVTINNRPGIPVKAQASYSANQIQAIANTAAFHFAMIEQGGSSLYDALSLNCATVLALRVVTSIEGSEVAHFEIWHDHIGDVPPVNSGDGLVFPNLNLNPATATDKVMPAPCTFISEDLPLCSIIRPTSLGLAGASAAVQFLTVTGLFQGQSNAFFDFMQKLARAADRAVRNDD